MSKLKEVKQERITKLEEEIQSIDIKMDTLYKKRQDLNSKIRIETKLNPKLDLIPPLTICTLILIGLALVLFIFPKIEATIGNKTTINKQIRKLEWDISHSNTFEEQEFFYDDLKSNKKKIGLLSLIEFLKAIISSFTFLLVILFNILLFKGGFFDDTEPSSKALTTIIKPLEEERSKIQQEYDSLYSDKSWKEKQLEELKRLQ